MFWEMLMAVMVGGLLIITTVGYCLFIAWRWVFKDVMEDMTAAYEVYLKRGYQTFEEK